MVSLYNYRWISWELTRPDNLARDTDALAWSIKFKNYLWLCTVPRLNEFKEFATDAGGYDETWDPEVPGRITLKDDSIYGSFVADVHLNPFLWFTSALLRGTPTPAVLRKRWKSSQGTPAGKVLRPVGRRGDGAYVDESILYGWHTVWEVGCRQRRISEIANAL